MLVKPFDYTKVYRQFVSWNAICSTNVEDNEAIKWAICYTNVQHDRRAITRDIIEMRCFWPAFSRKIPDLGDEVIVTIEVYDTFELDFVLAKFREFCKKV